MRVDLMQSSSSLSCRRAMTPGSERSSSRDSPGTCEIAVRPHRRRAAAAVARRLAAPDALPSGSRTAARAAAPGSGCRSRSQPRFTTSSRSPSLAAEIPQDERRRPEHRAVGPTLRQRAGSPDRSGAGEADRDAARTTRRCRSRSPRSSLQRSERRLVTGDGSAASTSGSRDARKLRQELPPSLDDRLLQLRLVVREVQERRRRRELLSLEQHRRRRAEQRQRGQRAKPAGRRHWCSRRPNGVFAT